MCHMKAVHYGARSAGPMKAKQNYPSAWLCGEKKKVERPYRKFT